MLIRLASTSLITALSIACTVSNGRADDTTAERAAESAVAQAVDESAPTTQPVVDEATAPASDGDGGHDVTPWAEILDRYVTDDGGFRYAALAASDADRARLDSFLASVAAADTGGWARDRELAFLINAYNAYTVASVVELWPIESVLAEDGFFDGSAHRVAGAEMTLNGLENDQIRARFDEPRIHFLVNCASTGCPWLIDEPMTADNLEMLLDRQTRRFLDHTVVVGDGGVRLSQIFEWFAGDFDAVGGVRAFVAGHLDDERADAVRDTANMLSYTPYDWSVNARGGDE